MFEFNTTLSIETLSEQVGHALKEARSVLVTAESCTGGGIAEAVTRVSGSSGWFDSGFVTYSNQSKKRLLGVSETILEEHGAVSIPVVSEMAAGALKNSHANCAVAVSGVAGPTGGTAKKPVGYICFAWDIESSRLPPVTFQTTLQGDRDAIRAQAVSIALQGILQILKLDSPRQ